jgi:hypothetical protein
MEPWPTHWLTRSRPGLRRITSAGAWRSKQRDAIEVEKALIEDVAFTLKSTEEGLLIRPGIVNIEVVINVFDLRADRI